VQSGQATRQPAKSPPGSLAPTVEMKTVLLSAVGVGAATYLGRGIAGGGWDASSVVAGGVIGGVFGRLLVVLDKLIVKRR
jgi:hypothetical protein